MSKWDKEYIKLCKKILKEGYEVENRTGINTLACSGYMLKHIISVADTVNSKAIYY